jgi:hypothetical protein
LGVGWRQIVGRLDWKIENGKEKGLTQSSLKVLNAQRIENLHTERRGCGTHRSREEHRLKPVPLPGVIARVCGVW